MGNRNQYGWNYQQSNAQEVSSLFEAGRVFPFSLKAPNLHGKRSSDRAWHVAGSNALIGLEAQGSKVLAGVTAMSVSSGSWSSPSRNLAEFSGQGEGKSGVNVLNGTVTNFVSKQWVQNHDSIAVELNLGHHVVAENNSQQQGDDGQAINSRLLGGVEQRLDGGQARQRQGGYSNDIARGGSFHPEIVARKEQFNGNL
mgnify:CR=1 FL=1